MRGFRGGFWRSGRLRRVLPYLLLAVFGIVCCQLFVLQYGVFGSRTDWINQHSVIPDYFRKRFYETGSLFPDFAWNIGGGQNIYHLSYYGLFSPVILLSYFFPFIRMDYYVMGSSILSYIISVLLFYRFLGRKKMSGSIRFGTSVFFALAASMIYQSYNQLMFINYMPFLVLSLIGTDDYLTNRKKYLLLLGVVGMILTSFYFSIGGMLALCLYALSEYLRMMDGVPFVLVLKKGACYVGMLLQAVLLCGILLVPAAISIFSSRQENAVKEQITLLSFDPLKVLYTPYGMGLSVLAIVAVFGGIFCVSKWQERILPAALMVVVAVPAIGFLLNGGLYDKQKVFIPFVPLVCLQCGEYASRKSFKLWREFLPWIFTGALLYLAEFDADFEKYVPLAKLDFCVTFLCFLVPFLFLEVKRRVTDSGKTGVAEGSKSKLYSIWMLFASCLCLFVYDMEMHPERERILSRDEYQNVVDSQKIKEMKNILKQDDSFFRMEEVNSDQTINHNNVNRIADIRQNITSMYSSCYNNEYWFFRKNTFEINEPFRNNMIQSATDNPCFLQFMGVKYLLHDGWAVDYEPVKGSRILKNTSAAPLLYVTDQTASEEEYKKYAFPTKQTALLQYAVVPDKEASQADISDLDIRQMDACKIRIPECDTPELTVKKTADGYEVTAKEDIIKELKITKESHQGKNNLFALTFDVDNKRPDSDMHVRINGQTNRLTAVSHEYANQNTNFTFMISRKKNENTISMEFSQGHYIIKNIKAFTGCLKTFQNPKLYQSPVTVKKESKSGSSLSGSVETPKAGFLITSIPYDENFKILLDGQEAEKLKVNTAFLGAKIPAGKHTITLIYHAPGKRAGLALTIAGIAILIAVSVLQNISEKRKLPE